MPLLSSNNMAYCPSLHAFIVEQLSEKYRYNEPTEADKMAYFVYWDDGNTSEGTEPAYKSIFIGGHTYNLIKSPTALAKSFSTRIFYVSFNPYLTYDQVFNLFREEIDKAVVKYNEAITTSGADLKIDKKWAKYNCDPFNLQDSDFIPGILDLANGQRLIIIECTNKTRHSGHILARRLSDKSGLCYDWRGKNPIEVDSINKDLERCGLIILTKIPFERLFTSTGSNLSVIPRVIKLTKPPFSTERTIEYESIVI